MNWGAGLDLDGTICLPQFGFEASPVPLLIWLPKSAGIITGRRIGKSGSLRKNSTIFVGIVARAACNNSVLGVRKSEGGLAPLPTTIANVNDGRVQIPPVKELNREEIFSRVRNRRKLDPVIDFRQAGLGLMWTVGIQSTGSRRAVSSRSVEPFFMPRENYWVCAESIDNAR